MARKYGKFGKIPANAPVFGTKKLLTARAGAGPKWLGGEYRVYTADGVNLGVCRYLAVDATNEKDHGRHILYFKSKAGPTFGLPYESLYQAMPARWCENCQEVRPQLECQACKAKTLPPVD